MGQLSLWHWVILSMPVGLVVLVVMAARSSSREYRDELHGVKGWLLLFAIGMVVLGPLVGLGQTAAAIGAAEREAPVLLTMDNWATYKAASWLVMAAVIAWQWFIVYGLIKHHLPASVARTKLFLALAPGVLTIADIVLTIGHLGVTAGAEWATGLIKGYVSSAVWYAYFARSRRVRNTYGLNQVRAAATPAAVSAAGGRAAPVDALAPGRAPGQQVEPTMREESDIREGHASIVSASKPAADGEGGRSLESRLAELKDLLNSGLISQQDYEAKKASLLQSL
jgi:hypothetical protein